MIITIIVNNIINRCNDSTYMQHLNIEQATLLWGVNGMAWYQQKGV